MRYNIIMAKGLTIEKKARLYPHLLTAEERLLIFEQVRGMWKHRKPDPIKELKKLRKEWERKLPTLH